MYARPSEPWPDESVGSQSVGGAGFGGAILRGGRELLDLLLPTSCASCGHPGQACCARCRAGFGRATRVNAPGLHVGAPVYALAGYRAAPRRLVLAVKAGGRRDVLPMLGEVLAAGCHELHPAAGGLRLVPVPSRRSEARRRGGGHVHRIAQHAAQRLTRAGWDACAWPALSLAPGTRDAVGLGPAGRSANLAGKVRFDPALRTAKQQRGPVLLVDDVVTTGATARACVHALGCAGVEVSDVLALTGAGR